MKNYNNVSEIDNNESVARLWLDLSKMTTAMFQYHVTFWPHFLVPSRFPCPLWMYSFQRCFYFYDVQSSYRTWYGFSPMIIIYCMMFRIMLHCSTRANVFFLRMHFTVVYSRRCIFNSHTYCVIILKSTYSCNYCAKSQQDYTLLHTFITKYSFVPPHHFNNAYFLCIWSIDLFKICW